MSPSFHLDAPAKINLGLRIVATRDDGYHELESLFVPLDLADGIALQVEPAARVEVSLRVVGEADGTPVGGDNLAARAARSFLERAQIDAHVEIGLTKHIPVAAGLGGGSSDAATVLRGLRRAYPDALEPAVLESLALSLGADVPYFLRPEPAWVSGIGEVREPVGDLPPLGLLLANPGEALATAEVYRAYDALEKPGACPPRPADLAQTVGDAGALQALLHNDLEAPAVRLCPPIGRLRSELEALEPRAVGMSGSGATLFAIFRDRSAAAAAAERLEGPEQGWQRVAATRD
ncbi:MAG: 4-(cytidine 5'-diphospho)-2-C-methyl-D-erythritol kinase [Myxococcota bacterium]